MAVIVAAAAGPKPVANASAAACGLFKGATREPHLLHTSMTLQQQSGRSITDKVREPHLMHTVTILQLQAGKKEQQSNAEDCYTLSCHSGDRQAAEDRRQTPRLLVHVISGQASDL